ncbi:DUF3352 domain-containing protein [Carboxylicivirga sp. RSCT41]|uniref:DUF3352 domain-containing protein n=1 Tax=Carboxylicivirga agarovorans TaxID=3417570 RepID=UPI003D3511C0
MKKGWVIATIFISCALLVYILFQVNRVKSYNNDLSLAALPSDAALIVKANSLGYIHQSLFHTVEFKEELKQSNLVAKLFGIFANLDSLSTTDGDAILKHLSKLPFYFSVHAQGKESVNPFYMFEIPNRKEEAKIKRFIKQLNDSGYDLNERKYNSKIIYEIGSGRKQLFIHVDNGLLLISSSNLLIESSIRQQQRTESWVDSDDFKQIYKTIGAGSKLNVFVNFKELPAVIKPVVEKVGRKRVNQLHEQSYWAELDVEIEEQAILLNGFMSSTNKGLVSQLLADAQPQRSRMHDVIPGHTRAYITVSVGSGKELKQRISKFHLDNNVGASLDRLNASYQKEFGFNFKDELFSQLTGELGLAYSDYNHLQPKANGALILKMKSRSTGQELLLEMLRKLHRQGNSPKLLKTYRPDAEMKFNIYHGFPDDIMKHLFGDMLPKVPQEFISFYDDNIILADAPVLIEQFIYSNMLNKTLSKSRAHQTFLSNFSSRENVFIFCETAHLAPLLGKFFNPVLGDVSESQKEAFGNFYGIGVQLSGTGQMIYTTSYLQYMPMRESEPRTVWQSLLDSTVIMKPTLVKNHYTKEREVMVQDEANNLYLLSNSGRVLWKRPLDSPVMSEIVQVDYYRNNKLQYLFNTRNSIFLIDRNGNNVAKFPVRLPSAATNGVAVCDYDNNRKYRLFVACENRRIYLYDGQGNKVSGWKFGKTDGEVTLPVQHFRSNGKDYIAFADNKRNYICDRKGNVRVKLSKQFVRNSNSAYFIENGNKSNDCLVTTDNSGVVKKIMLSNGVVKDFDVFDVENEHCFNLFSMNGKNHYLLSEPNSLEIKTADGSKVFDKDFDEEINLNIDRYQFSSHNIKFGISEKDNGNIYLLNNDGKMYKGFPLKGNSRFSIGFLKSSASRFNLIVGGSENYIYNYQVD